MKYYSEQEESCKNSNEKLSRMGMKKMEYREIGNVV